MRRSLTQARPVQQCRTAVHRDRVPRIAWRLLGLRSHWSGVRTPSGRANFPVTNAAPLGSCSRPSSPEHQCLLNKTSRIRDEVRPFRDPLRKLHRHWELTANRGDRSHWQLRFLSIEGAARKCRSTRSRLGPRQDRPRSVFAIVIGRRSRPRRWNLSEHNQGKTHPPCRACERA